MKLMRSTMVAVCALGGVLAVQPDLASAQERFNLKGRTSGHCELVNVEVGRSLYEGNCSIKETIKREGDTVIFEIRMGRTEPFLFATADGGRTWMHGPERVRFQDRGHTGIFRWGDFRLEVEQD